MRQNGRVIIRPRGSELLCIAQTAHAALAGAIMARWQLGGLPDHPRRDAILLATDRHDDGWREEDAVMHVGERGEPLDFVAVPPNVKQRIWPRGARRVAATSAYAGALVAQHALTVHASLRPDTAWRGFFAEMEAVRDALLGGGSPADADALAADYPFVRTGDLLSLIFCNGWTAPASGAGCAAILRGDTLEISPDPFGGRRLPMHVEARCLPARAYPSAAALREAYEGAPVRLLAGEAAGR